MKINQYLIDEAKTAIMIILVGEVIGFIGGLLTRVLYPFHYYPKISWLGLIIVVTVPICQIIFVTLGFELVGLSIVTFVTINFLNIIYLVYLTKLIKKEEIRYTKFYFLKNLNHLKNSFYLMIGNFAKMFKSEGVRLILSPMIGTVQMISYVTMKTASNFMKQFFFSFINSLQIEFIDYINEKNKDKFLY